MPAPRQDSPRRPPLTEAQRLAILHAVTVEKRSQRDIARDPAFGASHDQVRGVVARALVEDPTLLVTCPHLVRQPRADVSVLTLEESDDAPAVPTAAELLAGAGVDPAVLGMEIRSIKWKSSVRPRVYHQADGTVSAVCIPQASVEVEWVPVRQDAAANRRETAPHPRTDALDHRSIRAARMPWRVAAAVIVSAALLVFGARQLHHAEGVFAPVAAPSGGVNGGSAVDP